jgi:hypothetical protein
LRVLRRALDVATGAVIAGPATMALEVYDVGSTQRSGPDLMANVAPTPRPVATALVPALVLMLASAFSYVAAFHEPAPPNLPLAVVAPPAVAAQLDRMPGDRLDVRRASSRAIAVNRAPGPSSRR